MGTSAALTIPTLFTVGVYGSTADTFVAALQAARIDLVLDIRRRRAVRGPVYAFANARRLVARLETLGIAYRHLLALAPDAELLALQHAADAALRQRKSERTALTPAYVERYVSTILDRFDVPALAHELHGFRAPALLCVERYPAACHRSLVASRLAAELDAPVVDLFA